MNNGKSSGSGKKNKKATVAHTDRKVRLIVMASITAAVFITFSYIAYFTGLPAKVLTGVNVCGERITVCELNYQYQSVYNNYLTTLSNYGYSTDSFDEDAVMDETTGQTYREYFYMSAAKKLQSIIVLNKAAEKSDYKFESVEKQVDDFIDNIRTYASLYSMTADKWLANTYGSGSTVRSVSNYLRRELQAEEYQAYLMQTQFIVADDAVQALYDAAPDDYDTVTFHAYFISAGLSGTETDADKATLLATSADKAQAIVDASSSETGFVSACEFAAGDDGADSFADGADPTLIEEYSKTVIGYYYPELSDWLFTGSRQAGDKTVIESTSGTYAVYFVSRQLDQTPAAAYRSISISYYGDTDEEISASLKEAQDTAAKYMASITDDASFGSLVKKYSEDTSTMTTGGLVSGVLEQDLIDDAQDAADTAAEAAAATATVTPTPTPTPTTTESGALDGVIDQATSGSDSDTTDSTVITSTPLSEWLFSEDRVAGDMTVLTDETASTVTLYYFVSAEPQWMADAKTSMASDEYQTWVTDKIEAAGDSILLHPRLIDFATY